MNFRFLVLLALAFIICADQLFGQNFCSLEAAGGRILPNYPGHPSAPFRGDLGIGFNFRSDSNCWGSYFRDPDFGIMARYTYLGNSELLGNQYSIYPFIHFQLNKTERPVYLQLGMGLAIFDKPYDPIFNVQNQTVGANFSWHFNLALIKTLWIFPKTEYRAILGYYHASDGHIQIPNYGLNSFVLGGQVLLRAKKQKNYLRVRDSSQNSWYAEFRTGVGVHELAGTAGPVGTPKFAVFSTGLSVAYVRKKHLKYKFGIIGRYYSSYYRYQADSGRNPDLFDAGHIYLMAGAELLLGHVGLDVELGINVFRPFFKEFYDVYVDRNRTDYFLKKYINNRMGINYYLLNPYHEPQWNIRLGAFINANFGQADFSDLSLGIVYKLK